MQKKKAKHQHYAVDEKAATGHQIASILGQSQKGCVYTTTNNELRWEYWENDGELTDSLREIVAKFEVKIKGSDPLVLCERQKDREVIA